MTAKKATHPFYEKLCLVLIGIIALGYLVIQAKDVLDPLMFGFLFAILLLPVSNFFEKKLRLPRSASSLLSVLLFVAFIFGILYLVGSQISGLANDWPQLKAQVAESVNNLQEWISNSFHVNNSKQMAYVHNTTQKILAAGTD